MSSSREELTGKIIGLGSKSIRKNYYPELKQRIVELNKSLNWQTVLHKILADVSSCIKVEEVYRNFLDHFSELGWLKEDECIYIRYIPVEKSTLFPGQSSNFSDDMKIIYASEDSFYRNTDSIDFHIEIENVYLGVFSLELSPGHVLSESERELINTMIESILPTLRRICIENQKTALERELASSRKIQALGTLANGIAHDFNNILSGIFGYCELAKRKTDPEEVIYEYLQEIVGSAKRAKNLIDQILSFSRMKDVEKEHVDLEENIKQTVNIIKAAVPSGIEIKLKFPEDSPFIDANPSQLHQVFLNLFTNASHAMKKEGGELEILLEIINLSENEIISMESGKYVHISVKDTGHGMDSETLSHIFEPYFTTKKEGEGTGIGLAVVYRIVVSMKGKINVSSEPGKGTVFHLYFPVSQNNFIKIQPEKAAADLSGTEHLLLVDDDGAVLKVTKLILESLGYNVTACDSPSDALDMYTSDPSAVDLVLTDMSMPGMNGIELASNILKADKEQRMILISGMNEIADSGNIPDNLFKCTITKPVMRKDIAEAVRTVLDSK